MKQDGSQRRIKVIVERRIKEARIPFECVYVITSDHGVKIGRTTDIKKRFPVIRACSPVPLKLAHYFRCLESRSIESGLHHVFRDVRIHGEWFQLTPGDIAFLCGLTEGNYREAMLEFQTERGIRDHELP